MALFSSNRLSAHPFWSAVLTVFIGPFALLGSTVLIFWNEQHTIRVANSLHEGAAIVMEANAEEVDPALNGRLVHLARDTRTEGTLHDPQFGVKTSGIRLLRKVQVYQWIEQSRSDRNHSNSDANNYTYSLEWGDALKPSGSYHDKLGHENPLQLAYESAEYNAPIVRMGAYQLDTSLTMKLTSSRPLVLATADVQLPPGAQLTSDGLIYVGRDPHSPQVGDLRISERLVPTGAASVVAAVAGGRLTPFHARGGADIALVENGSVDAATMFESAQSSNRALCWFLRAAGLLGLYVGIRCLLRPLTALASMVPLLGGLMESGVGLVSLLGASIIWLVLVSLSWIAVRPLLGGGLLLAAFVVAAALLARLRKQRSGRMIPPVGGGLTPSMPEVQ